MTQKNRIDEWKIIETEFRSECIAHSETIFSTGNGYIGLRGNFEEGEPTFHHGTYLNGFYESEPIVYPEAAYGYASKSQTLLNVTDGKRIRLFVNEEPFDLSRGRLLYYRRTLDMRRGLLIRDIRWESNSGIQLAVHSKRLVCLFAKHIAAISYAVQPLNDKVQLSLHSILDGAVENQPADNDPRTGSHLKKRPLTVGDHHLEINSAALIQQTRNSGLSLVCAMENNLEAPRSYQRDTSYSNRRARVVFSTELKPGEQIRLSKYMAYYTSRDYPSKNLLKLAIQASAEAKERGFESLAREQARFLKDFWGKSDIRIVGDPALQQGLRFNLFQLLQSAGRDGKTAIPAKGLTGEGYEGHYFWDTEIYTLPFFIYTNPEIARKLLEFRFTTLPAARQRAGELGHRGALYPWRTINGDEASSYYPAGTAQYHINADIIYSLRKYLESSGDSEFLLNYGAEMLFETARMWIDLGSLSDSKDGWFRLNCVTGPDEYTALVNNNTYTNIMAKDHLEYAARIARFLRENHPDDFTSITARIGFREQEISDWERAASSMYTPYDREKGIHPQDDSFLQKAVWDFEKNSGKEPLLLHFHPLVIYRHQVLKQPDVVLALFLQGNRFSRADKKRNFDYYDPLTTGDSSLAPAVQCIVAAELGYLARAYRYFLKTARLDLDNTYGNVQDGIHTAAMGGSWLALVYGFAGLRDYDGEISFQPQLPRQWSALHFSLCILNRRLTVEIGRESVSYILLSGPALTIKHFKNAITLKPEQPVTVSLKPKPEAVIFDLDGVITDTSEYHYRAWKQIADEIGVPFDRKFNEKLKGVSRLKSLELILTRSGRSYSEAEKTRLAEGKNAYYRSLIKKITPADLLPGISALFAELKISGVKTALASVSRNAPEVIRRLKIKDQFDVLVNPEDICLTKPDPEIFFQAADQLNLPYQNCIGIEDAHAGVEAIKAAGMFAVGIGAELKEANWTLSDISQLNWKKLRERFYRTFKPDTLKPPKPWISSKR